MISILNLHELIITVTVIVPQMERITVMSTELYSIFPTLPIATINAELHPFRDREHNSKSASINDDEVPL